MNYALVGYVEGIKLVWSSGFEARKFLYGVVCGAACNAVNRFCRDTYEFSAVDGSSGLDYCRWVGVCGVNFYNLCNHNYQ